jgi:hypothetical protein
MRRLDRDEVLRFIDENIVKLYDTETGALSRLEVGTLFMGRNPYLMTFVGISSVPDLIADAVDQFLSRIEEELLNDFLRDLAVFVAQKTCNGHKSAAPGVDLEFLNKGVHYVVSIKSGPNWGNSSQQNTLERDLKNAVVRVKQSRHGANIQPVLGICYGKTKTGYVRGYLKVVGQNFWYLISENKRLYTDIIEPIGHRAKEHNDAFLLEKSKVVNRFTKAFIDEFCDHSGAIDWVSLVELNSGNFDLDRHLAVGSRVPKKSS